MLLTTLLMINVKTLFMLAVVFLLLVGCITRFKGGKDKLALPAPAYTTVGVQEFQNLITDPDVNIQLLDVRTRDEFDEGHIAGAMQADINESGFVERAMAALDANRPVAVYCRSGRRSAHAANLLAQQGLKVTNLDGGVIAWQDAGKVLVK